MSASSFYSMLALAAFLSAVWCSGKISRAIGVSSIVLEVATGLVLGPGLLALIPKELSECYDYRTVDCDVRSHQERIAKKGTEFCDLAAYLSADKYAKGQEWRHGFWGDVTTVTLDGHAYSLNGGGRRLSGGKEGQTDFDTYGECLVESCKLDLALRCAMTPDIFTLIGHTGVAMMIFESGMHFDFTQATTVGPWACAVAVLGTFLPIVFGAGLAYAYGFELIPDALSVGVSLAPTSVGIALTLLHEAKALATYFGQVVMTAAFVDDVLSLILFSILFSMGGNMSFMSFFPLLMGCVFMIVAIAAAVKVWPTVIKWILSRVTETKPTAKVTRHDEVLWGLMFVVLVAYAQITHLCGTHLWGCFIAGMSFSTHHHAHHVWVRQVKRVSCWFLRIFFACTLAWAIPIDDLFTLEAFWKGSLMGIGPCILTKVCCAPFMGKPRWVIGWAMVGRAEFAYFIAIMAKSTKMMEDKLFAILIWGLIYATIFAPLIFRKVLDRYMIQQTGNVPTHLAFRASGHLPDLEQEEINRKESQMLEEFDVMKKQLSMKDGEIVRLQSKGSLGERPEPQDDATELASLKLQLLGKDKEIAYLWSVAREAQAQESKKAATLDLDPIIEVSRISDASGISGY